MLCIMVYLIQARCSCWLKSFLMFEKVVRYEVHHVVPVSMGGWDCVENRLQIPQDWHAAIHKCQNIDGSMLRTFRLLTNHLPKDDPTYILELKKVHMAYFQKSRYLIDSHPHLIRLQAEKLHDFCIARGAKPVHGSYPQMLIGYAMIVSRYL